MGVAGFGNVAGFGAPLYLPHLLLQMVTCTECEINHGTLSFLKHIFQTGDVADAETKMGNAWPNSVASRIIPLTSLPHATELAVIPWFLKCNLQRYPYWTKQHDTRLSTQ